MLTPDPLHSPDLASQVRPEATGNGKLTAYLANPQQLNRYSYTLNNPIKYVDPDGKKAKLIIGGQYKGYSYGHTALQVYGEGYNITFDFGRYGRVWGAGGSQGEGMLNVWNSFESYIASENRLGRKSKGYVFNTTFEQDIAIMSFYFDKISGAKLVQSKNNFTRYRLSDNYSAAENNCTTICLDGLSAGLTDKQFNSVVDNNFNIGSGLSLFEKTALYLYGKPDSLFMPLDLAEVYYDHKNNISNY